MMSRLLVPFEEATTGTGRDLLENIPPLMPKAPTIKSRIETIISITCFNVFCRIKDTQPGMVFSIPRAFSLAK